MQEKKMSADAIADLLYRESGLKGLSGFSHDMRELEASDQPEAKQAIEYFVFRIQRELGGLTAAVKGLDAVVFCGGIGENAWQVRERVRFAVMLQACRASRELTHVRLRLCLLVGKRVGNAER
jgi:acetate kinase